MAGKTQAERTRKESGGNNKADAAWLAAVIEAGETHSPVEAGRPAGFLYDVKYQWEGTADEVNIDFFESFRRGTRACTGTAYVRDETGMYVIDEEWERITRPCLAMPIKGGSVCHAHGAKIPAVKAAAERVLAEASEVVAIRLVGLTAIRDEDREAIDHKVRLAAINSVLDRVGIKGGTELEITIPGYKKVLEAMFTDDSRDSE